MTEAVPAASPIPDIGKLTLQEVAAAIKAGIWDFRRAPAFGVFFSLFYVVVGLALTVLGADAFVWTLVLSLGFPLVAPFAAVGLYEVSRRIEGDIPLVWAEILSVVWAEKDRQLPWMGALLLIIFLFWSFLAHMLFALFMGPSALINISTSLQSIWTPEGYAMLAVQGVIGGVVAFFVFSATVVGLPLILDKEIDVISAVFVSLKAVRRNFPVMLIWAAIIAASLFLGMIPFFLGLIVVLPILGHATWHIYRRTLYHPI